MDAVIFPLLGEYSVGTVHQETSPAPVHVRARRGRRFGARPHRAQRWDLVPLSRRGAVYILTVLSISRSLRLPNCRRPTECRSRRRCRTPSAADQHTSGTRKNGGTVSSRFPAPCIRGCLPGVPERVAAPHQLQHQAETRTHHVLPSRVRRALSPRAESLSSSSPFSPRPRRSALLGPPVGTCTAPRSSGSYKRTAREERPGCLSRYHSPIRRCIVWQGLCGVRSAR
ncbi:hypothetical protein CALCODRAFT_109282 [Calocera cornea HHB12733]|uniref:Uncharacterized protein n=1 Tax=Calocera cornea HHB12733 TaxID=1353952 RepID=A0A165D2Y7_9BASI|nr:hypothetical protein CALCODRAFT_109282 [Calocera cornea HHB12733]